MYLVVDTSSPEHFIVALAQPDGRWLAYEKIESHFTQSEKLLPRVESLMKKNRTSAQDIAAICVVAGPGGFTSLRIGVVTADTLGFAWHKPVISIRTADYEARSGLRRGALVRCTRAGKDSQVLPQYGRPPHITKPKRRHI